MRVMPAVVEGMTSADWLILLGHFLLLSLLSIGGAITVASDMHRVMVDQMGLISDAQFSSSIAIAQASPGPNVLFVAVMGYQAAGIAGAVAILIAIMLPSTTLALIAARWGQQRRHWLSVRAFKAGMAPLVVGLLMATGWILASAIDGWHHYVLTALTALLLWKTRLHLLVMIGVGAVVGALGLI